PPQPVRCGPFELKSRPRAKVLPFFTSPAAFLMSSGVTKLSVPIWSSAPQRPQFFTFAAICSSVFSVTSCFSGRFGTIFMVVPSVVSAFYRFPSCAVNRASFDPDAGLLDDLRPARNLLADERAELFRRAAGRVGADRDQALLHLRRGDRPRESLVEAP